MRGDTVQVRCLCCGDQFTARVADRARGWGKFCDKSCKAYYQSYGPKKPSVVPTPATLPVIVNKKGEPPLVPPEKSWLTKEKPKKAKPKRESILDTPKPEDFGGWS